MPSIIRHDFLRGRVILFFAMTMVSCHSVFPSSDIVLETTDEIIFTAADEPSVDAAVTTKTSAVTSLSSFYASAVTGAVSDTQVWTNASFSGDNENGFKGDKWWPLEDPNYRFYASNIPLSYSSSGATVAATNAADVVCAYSVAPYYKRRNTLSFEHIFARLGEVTVAADDGNTISDVNITIVPKTGGTYNIKTGAGHVDGTGWSDISEAGFPSVIASDLGVNANDIFLVPGTYTLTASWRAERGNYCEDIEDMRCDVDLIASKINNISTTLSSNAQDVVFGVSMGTWTTRDIEVEFPTYLLDYLRFEFVTGGQVQWQNTKGDIQYSKNFGPWTDFDGSTVIMNAGEEILFRGSLTSGLGASVEADCSKFVTTGNFLVSGDVSSLCDFDSTLQDYHFAYLFKDCTGMDIDSTKSLSLPSTSLAPYCYYSMFYGCANLTSAPELPATTLESDCYAYMFYYCTALTSAPSLPATTLAQNCYFYMFSGCTSITTAPELPATTLVQNCYIGMFQRCTGLTSAPALPATTLTLSCYYYMFMGCTGLTSAPALPATTLGVACYGYMFQGCTSLSTAPELPATTLQRACYQNMFEGCTSLTTAPELPATTLMDNCYQYMFSGCTSLNYVKALFTTAPSSTYTNDWLSGVAATGTFVKADGASWDVTGTSGVPSGWTVIRESEE